MLWHSWNYFLLTIFRCLMIGKLKSCERSGSHPETLVGSLFILFSQVFRFHVMSRRYKKVYMSFKKWESTFTNDIVTPVTEMWFMQVEFSLCLHLVQGIWGFTRTFLGFLNFKYSYRFMSPLHRIANYFKVISNLRRNFSRGYLPKGSSGTDVLETSSLEKGKEMIHWLVVPCLPIPIISRVFQYCYYIFYHL